MWLCRCQPIRNRMVSPHFKVSSASWKARQAHNAFTLVELLVSIAVLMMIILFVGQLVNSATTVTVNSGKLVDADNQARLIFAQMSSDFAAMVSRADVSYYFHSNKGNDEFYFYSQA